ncbi:MAG: ATP-dependent zinc metalloprotease FtsH [Defluviitaleaceae bacterium]|nr:ATP-dependent zinc metalloprotease FtsH [Defluviitaleaceae bacterium]
MGKFGKHFLLYGIVFGFALLVIYTISNFNATDTGPAYVYGDLVLDITERPDSITSIVIQGDSTFASAGEATVTFYNGREITVSIFNVLHFVTNFAEPWSLYNPDARELDIRTPVQSGSFLMFLPTLILIVISVFLLFFIISQMSGGGGRGGVMSFSRTKAQVTPPDDANKVTFDKVRGLIEEKEDLAEIVAFLKHADKFENIGARVPKGVLLVGPPGTGKTLIARAVAGEAGVNFFSISGSDFVEMFVGVGASRVRDLFSQAKKGAPAIIFIDEIDAVGRRRGAGLGGGHDEREQTLNQLLVEMDGFGKNTGVIVLAATNRPDILDPAILRPGRFDRRVVINRPDVGGREDILRLYAETKRMADDVDFKAVAQTTPGFTGADLENLLNEAALLAARDNQEEISAEYIRKAFVKIGIGTEKKSRVVTERERRITAYHEAGHAIMFEMLPDTDPVHMISIISTGQAGGYTMPLPMEERLSMTKGKMEQEIAVLLGGRVAEKLVIGDITTGASNDIERATGIARNMVMRYGMSDAIGPIQLGGEAEEVFIGRDWGQTRNFSENMAQLIDTEIKRIVEDGYQRAMAVLTDCMDIMHTTVDLLLKKEKITGAEFRALFPEGRLVKKDRTDAMSKNVVAPEEVYEQTDEADPDKEIYFQ